MFLKIWDSIKTLYPICMMFASSLSKLGANICETIWKQRILLLLFFEAEKRYLCSESKKVFTFKIYKYAMKEG